MMISHDYHNIKMHTKHAKEDKEKNFERGGGGMGNLRGMGGDFFHEKLEMTKTILKMSFLHS